MNDAPDPVQPPPPLRPEPSPQRFTGAVALVVGGGHGIGAATAERLAAEDATVIVADLDADAARSVVAALPPAMGSAHEATEMDATDTAAVERVLADLGRRHGRIDLLAVIAGGDPGTPLFEQTDDEWWDALVDLNLMGPVRVARAAIPWLRRSDRGAVVLTSSVNALLALEGEPYSAAKAGLHSLTQNLASRLGPEGIRVNAVAPGTVHTRVWGDEVPDRVRRWYPLRRVGEPADIAAAIAFLGSGDAAWITGHVLPVDGGLLVRGPGPQH